MTRETVKFEANIPVSVTLKYAQGKIIDGRFGDQVMWGLAGDKVMFLPLGVAEKLNELKPQAGDSVTIVKMQSNQQTRWNVWFTQATEVARAHRGEAGNELPPPDRDESTVAQQLRGTIQNIREGKPPASPRPELVNAGAGLRPAPASTSGEMPASKAPSGEVHRSNPLIDEANDLVDAYAAVLDRALTKYQGRIKPDEIKSILLSCYIQQGKAAKYAAA